jgi:ATP-dependent DNA ligase
MDHVFGERAGGDVGAERPAVVADHDVGPYRVAVDTRSRYESGAWLKMRVNRAQEFVIGGCRVGGATFNALICGYHEDGQLIDAARTRNGFTARLRQDLMKRFQPLEVAACPFANLPETTSGRWGAGLTAKKVIDCRWLTPVLVGRFEFVEWTGEHHLRHTRFMGLRDDRRPKDIVRER